MIKKYLLLLLCSSISLVASQKELEKEFGQLLEKNPHVKSILTLNPDQTKNFLQGTITQKVEVGLEKETSENDGGGDTWDLVKEAQKKGSFATPWHDKNGNVISEREENAYPSDYKGNNYKPIETNNPNVNPNLNLSLEERNKLFAAELAQIEALKKELKAEREKQQSSSSISQLLKDSAKSSGKDDSGDDTGYIVHNGMSFQNNC